MQLCIDLDVALLSVRNKLDKECRAYYFWRELSKGSSGYISRKAAISSYMERTGSSYGTANRRVNALLELGWAVRAKKGNIHINGLYRVKTLLHTHFSAKMGFIWRRRTALVDLFAGENTLDNFKGGLTAALTADKLSRNLTKAKAGISFNGNRVSKAEIGTALAQLPHIECYAHTLKCRDWNLSAGTVNRRKKVSEALKLELYDWQRVDGLCFRSREEAIQGAIALGYIDREYRKVFFKDGSYGLRGADKIRTRVELKRRAKPNNGVCKNLLVSISGQEVLLASTRTFKAKDYWFFEGGHQYVDSSSNGCSFEENSGELSKSMDSHGFSLGSSSMESYRYGSSFFENHQS